MPQIGPSGVARRVGRDVVEPRKETFERLRGLAVDALNFISASFTLGAESVAIEVPARDADDPRGLGELLAALAMEKRRIELAISEVARPAEHDEIKRINLDDARSHVASQV